ncbi:hypothetical protein K501DRAFT_293933 [Backusella circina FSU 941]|nr:hypothetical protein K501DRAFT_293933 [Backusella circina FSU 941]
MKLLSFCRPKAAVDPILWVPMTREERSRCQIYWPKHPSEHLTKQHAMQCLSIHRALTLSTQIEDPVSFLLNRLPTRPLKSPQTLIHWRSRWPALCTILLRLDRLIHDNPADDIPDCIGQSLV